jgi:hypothetical protein
VFEGWYLFKLLDNRRFISDVINELVTKLEFSKSKSDRLQL